MYRALFLPVMALLSACGSGDESKARDLNAAISFSDLVEKRLQVDTSIDGKTMLITSEVNTYFDQNDGCANDALPMCTEDLYSHELSQPVYRGTGVGACDSLGVELTNGVITEKLEIDLDTYNEFFSLNEEYNVPVNFYAKIEFVDRPVWCGAQVNLGIKLTLEEGEESHLFQQLK